MIAETAFKTTVTFKYDYTYLVILFLWVLHQKSKMLLFIARGRVSFYVSRGENAHKNVSNMFFKR